MIDVVPLVLELNDRRMNGESIIGRCTYKPAVCPRTFDACGIRICHLLCLYAWCITCISPSLLSAKLIQPSKKAPLLNSVQHNALELTVKASKESPVRLVNEGFWGINAVQGRSYHLTFWAKALKYQGNVKAMLYSHDGSQIYAETMVREN